MKTTLKMFKSEAGIATDQEALLVMVKGMNEGLYEYTEVTADGDTDRVFDMSTGPKAKELLGKLGFPTNSLTMAVDFLTASKLLRLATEDAGLILEAIGKFDRAHTKNILVCVLYLYHYVNQDDELGSWLEEFIGIRDAG